MSIETNLRYEKMGANSQTIQRVRKAEQERLRAIEQESELAGRLKQQRKDYEHMQAIRWAEKLSERGASQKLINSTIDEEVRYTNKVVKEQRRAALKQLYTAEHQLYDAELRSSGKAFFTDRL